MSTSSRMLSLGALVIAASSVLLAQAGPPQGPPPQGLPPGAQGPPPGGPQGGPPGGRPGGPGPQAARSPREMAPIDLTGNWVSVVVEDWRTRMMTPPKGEFLGVPMTAAARTAANAWDPAQDEAAGAQCKAYGAPALMRNPGRAQISWQDDNTLKIDYDNGQQTRLLRFAPTTAGAGANTSAVNAEPSWQGYSVAEWEREVTLPSGMGGPGGGRGFGPPVALTGALKVVTTRLRPGYLRKNGVPYGANAVLTEYVNLRTIANGDVWFTVQAIVEDPENLTGPFVTSSDFKREPDGSKRMPMPCSAK